MARDALNGYQSKSSRTPRLSMEARHMAREVAAREKFKEVPRTFPTPCTREVDLGTKL